MQSTISFDTLQFMYELKKAGIKQEEAEAITKATANAFTQMMETKEIVTKHDLQILKDELKAFIIKALTTSLMIAAGLQTVFHFTRI